MEHINPAVIGLIYAGVIAIAALGLWSLFALADRIEEWRFNKRYNRQI